MNDDLRSAALHASALFYGEHASQHLSRDEDQLQALCADMVASRFGVATREGLAIAMTARANMLSLGTVGFIDLDRSTSRMVVLRDAERDRLHMLPVSQLLAIARNPD